MRLADLSGRAEQLVNGLVAWLLVARGTKKRGLSAKQFENGRQLKVITAAAKLNTDRPVLVLQAPPGCGKTCLVHVAAKEADYQVMESVNQELRTGKDLRTFWGEALSTQQVGERSRLILLDDVDTIRDASFF